MRETPFDRYTATIDAEVEHNCRDRANRHARDLHGIIDTLNKSPTAEERREWWSDSGRCLEVVVL